MYFNLPIQLGKSRKIIVKIVFFFFKFIIIHWIFVYLDHTPNNALMKLFKSMRLFASFKLMI